LFERKGCIIPADGFYEWMQTDNGKQPMRIMIKSGEVFAFAGLYDTWTKPDGQILHTCTIITTRPNEIVANIHDRMPMIMRQEDEDLWLDRERFDPDLVRSLVPYDATEMRSYLVPALVWNPQNNTPESIEEIPLH
jgi:putative SOS response-associated peptidase YedK